MRSKARVGDRSSRGWGGLTPNLALQRTPPAAAVFVMAKVTRAGGSAELGCYVAYPLGLDGVVVGQGDSYEEAMADVNSAIRFHIETFGPGVLDVESPVLEAFSTVPVTHQGP